MVCGGAFGQQQKIAQNCVESRRKFSPTKAKAELNEPQLHGHVVCAAGWQQGVIWDIFWDKNLENVESDRKEGGGSWQFYNLIVLPSLDSGL